VEQDKIHILGGLMFELTILLILVTIIFITWLSRNLLSTLDERDEWRRLAVESNAQWQELEQIMCYEDMIVFHRDEDKRPYRASTLIDWGKSMQEWHSTRNPNQGE